MSSLEEPIAGSANVYPWGDGFVLKLHGPGAPRDGVAWIGRVERALFQAGLPVPAVGEMLEIEGRLGQVYERIEGPSIAQALFSSRQGRANSIVELAHIFAEVQAEIHACGPIEGFATQQEALARAIKRAQPLTDDQRQAALAALSDMPAGDRLCHGDYHPSNVLLSPRGPVAIDWPNGHIGDPLEDVARSLLILDGVAVSQPPLVPAVRFFQEAYHDRYFELRPGDKDALQAWRPIVAAVRLTDRIPELEDWLVAQVRAGLGV